MPDFDISWVSGHESDYPNFRAEILQIHASAKKNLRGAAQFLERDAVNVSQYGYTAVDKDFVHYEKYFGAFDEDRARFVANVFSKMAEILHIKKLKIVVETAALDPHKSNDTIAYTYLNAQDASMWVSKLFVEQPTTGDNSKLDTLVHELAHNVTTSVVDQNKTYGMDKVIALAKSDPEAAINCAESYGFYFVEGLKNGIVGPPVAEGWSSGWVYRAGPGAQLQADRFETGFKTGLGYFGQPTPPDAFGPNKFFSIHSALTSASAGVSTARAPSSGWIKENQRSRWVDVPDDDGEHLFVSFIQISDTFDFDHDAINGRWSCDDNGRAVLYNDEVGEKPLSQSNTSWNKWTEFSATQAAGLRYGHNEIRFYVKNDGGGAGGLRVEIEPPFE
ncbi:M35 family metallo-endopeptidase [Pontivivens insulae]|uniref:Lysine-specific metallo-endopeptidase domain-containing protein n=1 Tax=Pontivivens insulae TaxID=1639689 RepID=A0A2R8A8M4_9RHOB|nr:M35 family metallo-endopeptidase [Pontivivens insulae]RED18470.1 lysine-specific metallo-endopeptidase family protein [Pontivivens insulae]SPF28368.1 hypothetical protein POI8812_00666 [Pontivivens insulae]